MADRTLKNKRTYVNTDLCIACVSCVAIDDTDTFFMDEDDGWANTKDNNLALEEAAMVCPTQAIFIKSLEEFKQQKERAENDPDN
ncbi:ferredoxin [Spiroplasma endosymbiont of Anurida maritima]|uniref:ferredoxin n=1 Tax=Spiroplasma endosymbiont of Anurida maritima TaxID=2967972 RepID=UPI0036D2DA87